ncbi:acyl carrier protein [Azospirillum sp. sgz301742]
MPTAANIQSAPQSPPHSTIDPAVTQAIRSFIVESFLLGHDSGFDNAESLLESGIIDSTGIMHVVAFLEETFSVAIDDDDLVADNLDSVERIAGFVGRKRIRMNAA